MFVFDKGLDMVMKGSIYGKLVWGSETSILNLEPKLSRI